MPLPVNSTLSLLPAGAGNDSSKKKAMIVRMSTETLDALEGFPDHPAMDFDLGENPARTFHPILESHADQSPREFT